jgi:MraZ protein
VVARGGIISESPRFSGRVEHALDDKGRLVVPARFRERLGPGFVLTALSPDRCLALYPSAAWQEISARLAAAPRKDETYRRLVRFTFANTEEPVACDAQGRILIPASLRSYAEIERDVVSVGSLTRVEIWARERYAEFGEPKIGDDDLFAELGLL